MSIWHIDFSQHHPDPAEIVAAGVSGVRVYLGLPSRPSVDYCRAIDAAGLAGVWIFETDRTRAYEGYAAGFLDGGWADAVADELWPAWPIAFAAADTPNVSGHEAEIEDYAYGFAMAMQRDAAEPYGPLAALLAARRGIAHAGKSSTLWGIETWIPGATSDPTHNVALWADAGADVVQMANVASPVGDSDLDVVINPAYMIEEPDMTPEQAAQLAAIDKRLSEQVDNVLNDPTGGVVVRLGHIEAAVDILKAHTGAGEAAVPPPLDLGPLVAAGTALLGEIERLASAQAPAAPPS